MLPLSAAELHHLKQLIELRRPGHGLPRPLYHDELLYRAEMDGIWRAGWLFAGHSCQIPNPGDYFLYEVDGDSIIIVRGPTQAPMLTKPGMSTTPSERNEPWRATPGGTTRTPRSA